jgi:hypothetical protein
VDMPMLLPELLLHAPEQCQGLGFRQSAHPLDYPLGTRVAAWVEEASDCASGIRLDPLLKAVNGNLHRIFSN